jgi:hypothetical protein
MARSANKTEEGGEMSNTDIAAMLLTPVTTSDDDVKDDEAVVVEEAPTSGEIIADTDPVGDDLEDGEDADEDQQEEEPVEEEDETGYVDIYDTDLTTVTVDGEAREVSIADLKKAFSGEGAIEKRLQDATELRRDTHAAATQTLEKLAAQQQTLESALSSLDDSVFAGVIPKPNEEMRRSNPERYLQHQEAYTADQQRVTSARQAVETKIAELSKDRNDRLAAYRQEAGQVVVRELPDLVDPDKAPALLKKLSATAQYYGYTEQEIQTALDPRMFMLVRDAMKYRDMTSRTREKIDPLNLEGQNVKKVRRLRTGSAGAKTRVRQADKTQKAATAKARSTGKASDVAATLLVPRG